MGLLYKLVISKKYMALLIDNLVYLNYSEWKIRGNNHSTGIPVKKYLATPPPPPIKKNFAFYVRYLLKFKLKMARLYMAKFFGDVMKGLICI